MCVCVQCVPKCKGAFWARECECHIYCNLWQMKRCLNCMQIFMEHSKMTIRMNMKMVSHTKGVYYALSIKYRADMKNHMCYLKPKPNKVIMRSGYWLYFTIKSIFTIFSTRKKRQRSKLVGIYDLWSSFSKGVGVGVRKRQSRCYVWMSTACMQIFLFKTKDNAHKYKYIK